MTATLHPDRGMSEDEDMSNEPEGATQTLTLTDFLLARIAEDETAFRWGRLTPDPDDANYDVLRWDDERGRAECKAKRQIVEMYEVHRSRRDAYRAPRSREIEDEQAAQDRRTQEARCRAAEDAALAIASVYANHPDYREEWKP